jgi:hypothetical protein
MADRFEFLLHLAQSHPTRFPVLQTASVYRGDKLYLTPPLPLSALPGGFDVQNLWIVLQAATFLGLRVR